MNCPKCGSKQASSEWNNAFECGTMGDRRGGYHHTTTCYYFSEFRKPIDAEVERLKAELAQANEYARKLSVEQVTIEEGSVQMSLSQTDLDKLDFHWAVSSITKSRRERAFDVARYRLVQGAVGKQMCLEFLERDDDEANLEKVAMAYELAAIEGIDACLRPQKTEADDVLRGQAQAGAFRAYELRRALPIPSENAARVFEILHRGALAYCSDRWTDLRRWLKENPSVVVAPSVATAAWDERVLFRVYDCWIRLFRKNQWDDLDRVREIIAGLRVDQKQHESGLLEAAKQAGTNAPAFRLVALYHWAKATEQLAIFMLQGTPPAVDTELDQHFESARHAAQDASDVSLDVLLRWLHVASRRMVGSSIWWVANLT